MVHQEFFQRENELYIIGGYGYSSTVSDHITYSYLTAVDVNGVTNAIVNGIAPTTTDNCGIMDTTYTLTDVATSTNIGNGTGDASGSTFPMGTTTNTYTFAGVTCSFDITVSDSVPPIITCPGNVNACDGIPVGGLAPLSVSDNCSGTTIAYTLSGATTGSGTNDASGNLFNVGFTTVTYTATDTSGNVGSCSFYVITEATPAAAIDPFNPDTICLQDASVSLPNATPIGGTYFGDGVVGTNFDPGVAGAGIHYVKYSYNSPSGRCTGVDSTMMEVIVCIGIDENNSLSDVEIFPNPANDIINVLLNQTSEKVNLKLSSIDGKVVFEAKEIANQKIAIDISGFSEGVYFLRVENDKDHNVYKVIKQ